MQTQITQPYTTLHPLTNPKKSKKKKSNQVTNKAKKIPKLECKMAHLTQKEK